MSWDVILIKTESNSESMEDITTDLLIPFPKQAVLDALKNSGEIVEQGKRIAVKLGATTYIDIILTENDDNNVLTVHFDIGGKLEFIKPYLTAIQEKLGGRYYDVSNQYFFSINDIE